MNRTFSSNEDKTLQPELPVPAFKEPNVKQTMIITIETFYKLLVTSFVWSFFVAVSLLRKRTTMCYRKYAVCNFGLSLGWMNWYVSLDI